MNLLKHRGRLFLEFMGLLYGGLMILLAITEWAGQYTWRLSPGSLLTMAGVAFMVVIYLVLDEIRLNTRR